MRLRVCCWLLLGGCFALSGEQHSIHRVLVDVSHSLNTFDPADALGAGIDGHEKGDIARTLTPANVAAMRSAGLKPLSYRLRTELAGEAWHWNPKGTWSDAAHRQGYWLSDSTLGEPIDVSYGYKLPRRGNTNDQANNDGYSRITDGDTETFWKSNPYLDPLPQWVVVDLGKKTPVDSLRIRWGTPWAQEFTVQYCTRDDLEVSELNIWRDFPEALQHAPNGGDGTVRVSARPMSVRKVRIVLRNSKGEQFPAANGDPRDRLGFAIREISVGTQGPGGFRDAVRHSVKRELQSVVWVSSTDPWHRAVDLDPRTEQPGFDRVFQSGLTNGMAMMTPAGILYDTPENAAAEIRYLLARKFPVKEVEFGEEPEEQQISPELYGELYRKFAAAVQAVDATLKTGGPSLVLLAPEVDPDPSWTKRWINDMRAHKALGLVKFFSFEWYPYDDVCEPVAPQLARHSKLLQRSLARLAQDGVPREIPWYMTEYGYSAFGTQAEVDLPGAILNADTVATFLSFGGAKAFLYGYEPGDLLNEKKCTWGNNMLFLAGEPLQKMATYYGAKLLTQHWTQPGKNILYAASVDQENVSVYAVERPDHTMSLLLLNKDPLRAQTVQVPLGGKGVEVDRYSASQYQWHAAGDRGKPVRNNPPEHLTLAAGKELVLPPFSITVASGLYVKSTGAK